ncbi:MAG: 2-C-methyl-D-erythritol 2,4-cyclodiphosphate synthase [Acidobacteria bacterium]|nr:2-C-methyl-D-erythritol 2,4-cyclodiphosphate synthase [Acidobacteriota bacterium]
MTIHAIVPAAGEGRRFGGGRPKQFSLLLDRPVLAWTVERVASVPMVDRVVVAAPAGKVRETQEMLAAEVTSRPGLDVTAVEGGARRQDSVAAALAAAAADPSDWVAVHDGARPCLSAPDLEAVVRAAAESGGAGAVLGRPVSDTLKTVTAGRLGATVDRASLFRAETPQVFRAAALAAALDRAAAQEIEVSDESSLFEPGSVAAVVASRPNPKLTDPSDRATIEALLRSRRKADEVVARAVGHGYDVHRLRPGRPLILGGQRIPHELGLDGHSDADVVLHAIGDALLGAAGLGDLGVHFPPSDDAWRGADSSDLLRRIVGRVRENGFEVRNCDVTLVAERPRMAPYRAAIEDHVARLLGLDAGRMNFKATTHEGLGPLGRGEGMAAEAVVLLERRLR